LKGYTGKILWVDLSEEKTWVEEIPERIYTAYLSGTGLASYILYREIPAGADPLGPENVLAFVSGLLTGTGAVVMGRWMVATKSPLTGGWGDSNCGGTFSPAIKQCGYDGIFVKGQASRPLYLLADHREARLMPAKDLWGLDAIETEESLMKRHWEKKKPSVVSIGQAGERVSLISGIVNDGGRIAARSGVGAVMGSKKLKAVVLKGILPMGGQDPAAIHALSREFSDKIRRYSLPGLIKGSHVALGGRLLGLSPFNPSLDGLMFMPLMKKWGTSGTNGMAANMGDSPVKNWSGSIKDYSRPYVAAVNPDHIAKLEVRKYHCYSCVIGCGGICRIDGKTGGRYTYSHKPEYETVSSFSSLVMGKDLDAVYEINEMLNRAGMDTISAGHVSAWAIESFEKGLITTEDTDGLVLEWGNLDTIKALLEKMIRREGIGDLLADGVKLGSERIGRGSQALAMHCGGQEPAMHDSRLDPILGVIYSVDTTPGRHTTGSSLYYGLTKLWERVSWAPRAGWHSKNSQYKASREEALKTLASVAYKQVVDGAGGCLFAMISGVQHYKVFDWLEAATGWGFSPDDYMHIGRRISTTKQLFNIKQGINPLASKMPDRMAGLPPLTQGPLKGRTVPVEEMIANYFEVAGWDRGGCPKAKTLEALGIDSLKGGECHGQG